MAAQHPESFPNPFYFIIPPWVPGQRELFVNINILSVWDAVINEHTLKLILVSVWFAPTRSAILRNSLRESLEAVLGSNQTLTELDLQVGASPSLLPTTTPGGS